MNAGPLGTALIAGVLLLTGCAGDARAQSVPVVHDTQAWLLLLGQIPLGDAWVVHAEAQPRFNDDISQKDQLLLRGALGEGLLPPRRTVAAQQHTAGAVRPRRASDDPHLARRLREHAPEGRVTPFEAQPGAQAFAALAAEPHDPAPVAHGP